MTIRVYTGRGTSRTGSPLLVEELSKHLRIPVAGICHNEMRNSNAWAKETTTLIFAGQSVGQFKEALGEDVLKRINAGVYEGAFDYIGICAGVAFASSHIKYRMKPVSPNQQAIKIQNTGLSLYYGLATGPCRSVSELPFSGGPENLFLINLRSGTDFKRFNAFFWGGPAIIPLETEPAQKNRMLAFLERDGTPLAIRTKFGRGNVSLFSYHPEIHAGNIGRWAEARFIPESESMRLESLARQLDGTAFLRFLDDSGLSQYLSYEKGAAPAAPHVNLHLL